MFDITDTKPLTDTNQIDLRTAAYLNFQLCRVFATR